MGRPLGFFVLAGAIFLPKNRALKLLAFGVLVVFCINAQHPSVHDLFGTNEFHRAYFAENAREVTFDGFQDLNWEAKARAALPWLNLDRPTREQIARLSTFE